MYASLMFLNIQPSPEGIYFHNTFRNVFYKLLVHEYLWKLVKSPGSWLVLEFVSRSQAFGLKMLFHFSNCWPFWYLCHILFIAVLGNWEVTGELPFKYRWLFWKVYLQKNTHWGVQINRVGFEKRHVLDYIIDVTTKIFLSLRKLWKRWRFFIFE